MLRTLGEKDKAFFTLKALVTLDGEDEQREQLRDTSIEIHAYTQALKKVEAQLVAHQQSQLWIIHKELYKTKRLLIVDVTGHMTRNKAYLETYTQYFPSGLIAFRGSQMSCTRRTGQKDQRAYSTRATRYTSQQNELLKGPRIRGLKKTAQKTFLENKPNVVGKGPTWLFDLDYLTDSMNYQPVRSENQANKHAGPKEANHSVGTEDNIDAGNSKIEAESAQDYFVLPIWSSYTSTVKSSKAKNAGEEPNKNPDLKTNEKPDANDAAEALRKEFAQDTEDLLLQAGAAKASSTNTVNTASTPVSTASPYGGYLH
ncbi:hypothetical protein Tco_1402916 [Tanacetum coccineum]